MMKKRSRETWKEGPNKGKVGGGFNPKSKNLGDGFRECEIRESLGVGSKGWGEPGAVKGSGSGSPNQLRCWTLIV